MSNSMEENDTEKASIGFKSWNLRKKAGVKFNDLFLLTERIEKNFSHFSMILPLIFSEILNICRN